MLPVAAGLLLGVAGAWMASRLMTGLLYEISPRDPTAFTAAFVVLVAAATVAAYVPARRAMGTDPLRILKGRMRVEEASTTAGFGRRS